MYRREKTIASVWRNISNLSVCVDIDECERLTCDQHAKSSNNPGSFSCICNSGFTHDSKNSSICLDVNECEEEPCDRNANCVKAVSAALAQLALTGTDFYALGEKLYLLEIQLPNRLLLMQKVEAIQTSRYHLQAI